MKFITIKDSISEKSNKFPLGTEIHLNENGQIHREDGPAIIFPNGKKIGWYKNGLLHRTDGPAIIATEHMPGIGEVRFEQWFIEGKMHRIDGPAYLYEVPSHTYKKWYINGQEIMNNTSQKRKWIILRGDIESFESFASFLTKEMQEYIIQNRPDLIGKIPLLDPELKERYQHELSLANVDV